MKRLLTFLTAAVLLVSMNAQAQLDPDLDGIGMYFDPDANVNCMDFFGGPLTMYLCITNPSEPSGIAGWEAHVEYVLPPGNFEQGWTLMPPGFGINVSVAPDFVVGLSVPLPWAPSVVVATYGILVFAPDCMWFKVREPDFASIPGSPIYAAADDPGNLIVLQPSAFNNPNAGLNCIDCDPTIPTEDSSWGGVKAMYT